MKGLFISFEGIEGTGKTTQARLLAQHLSGQGYRTVLTEEPGGTAISLKIRDILLTVEHTEMHRLTELLLYNASRCQHLYELILPALENGTFVITDRFSDSTMAYQGFGRGIDRELIEALDRIVTSGLRPDLTFLLDSTVETGLKRNRGAQKVDRLELEDRTFHEKVRAGFRALAAQEPGRIKIIDASRGVEEVQQAVVNALKELLHQRNA